MIMHRSYIFFFFFFDKRFTIKMQEKEKGFTVSDHSRLSSLLHKHIEKEVNMRGGDNYLENHS